MLVKPLIFKDNEIRELDSSSETLDLASSDLYFIEAGEGVGTYEEDGFLHFYSETIIAPGDGDGGTVDDTFKIFSPADGWINGGLVGNQIAMADVHLTSTAPSFIVYQGESTATVFLPEISSLVENKIFIFKTLTQILTVFGNIEGLPTNNIKLYTASGYLMVITSGSTWKIISYFSGDEIIVPDYTGVVSATVFHTYNVSKENNGKIHILTRDFPIDIGLPSIDQPGLDYTFIILGNGVTFGDGLTSEDSIAPAINSITGQQESFEGLSNEVITQNQQRFNELNYPFRIKADYEKKNWYIVASGST